MNTPETHPVRQVLTQVVTDGKITADQVDQLENFVNHDWVIDQDEVQMLFRVNHSIGTNDEECPQWTQFFISNVSRLVVMDMNTPGVIDESEGDWLAGLLDNYACGNESEQKLFFELQNTTSSIEGLLAEKLQPYE